MFIEKDEYRKVLKLLLREILVGEHLYLVETCIEHMHVISLVELRFVTNHD